MRTFFEIIVLFCCVILTSCARIVTPTGGQRDVSAPKYVASNPKLNATNFKGDRIDIEFDEYIVLDNATGKLIVSPPLKNKPTVGSKLRTLYIKGLDSLQENTTYIFDFGDAITDYTEGNRLQHFSFAFSTSDIIDTLGYSGRLVNAYTLKPEPNKYVTLYRSNEKQYMRENLPDYITRTDSNGRFVFQNIKEGNYNVLAFEDMNQNMLYDIITEGYGYKADIYVGKLSDKDSNKTVFADTVLFNSAEDTVQKILSSKLINERELQIITSLPVSDSLSVLFTKPELTTDDFLLYRNKTSDTITLINCLLQGFDTVKCTINDKNGFSDKIDLVSTTRKKRNKDDRMSFNVSLTESNISYFQDIVINSPYVVNIKQTPFFKALILSDTDTNEAFFRADSFNVKTFVCKNTFQADKDYIIMLDSAVIRTFDNKYNDTLNAKFHIKSKDDFGSLLMNVSFEDTNFNSSLIMTLFDEKNEPLQTINTTVGNCKNTLFENITEGKYRLRLIIDSNNNNKWDRGDFDKNQEPETVIYYSKTISVRKGWQTQEDWIIHSNATNKK